MNTKNCVAISINVLLFLRDRCTFRRQRRLHIVTFVILRGYVAVQCPHIPRLRRSSLQIPPSGGLILHT